MSLGALLLAISQGQNWGWSSPSIVALFGVFAIGLAAFAFLERRSKSPVIDLELVRSPLFLAASGTAFFSFTAFQGALFLVPFFLMDVQHYSGSQVGLLLLPFFLPMALVSPLAGWLTDRLTPRLVTLSGMALTTTALGLLSLIAADTAYWFVAIASLILGIGIAVALPPLGKAIIGAAPLTKLGAASGVFSMVRSMGGPFGVALLTTVFAERAAVRGREAITGCLASLGLQPAQVSELRHLQEIAQQSASRLTADQLVLLRQLGPHLQEAQDCARVQGLLAGSSEAFLIAAALSLLGVLTALFIRHSDKPRRSVPTPTAARVLAWTAEAEVLLEHIPAQARERAREGVETYTLQLRLSVVTPDIVRQALASLR
ncbi:MAG: MFS transporter [Chloroflexota bacterium]